MNTPRQANQPPYRAHLLHVSYDEFLPDRTRIARMPACARIIKLVSRRERRQSRFECAGRPRLHASGFEGLGKFSQEDCDAHHADQNFIGTCRVILQARRGLPGGVHDARHVADLEELQRSAHGLTEFIQLPTRRGRARGAHPTGDRCDLRGALPKVRDHQIENRLLLRGQHQGHRAFEVLGDRGPSGLFRSNRL
ncbi:MAG: hypothetical protein NTV94_08895 [Planctomycetota bacterium]|nr:hypothetical protein [Planctomycetota bacterium]